TIIKKVGQHMLSYLFCVFLHGKSAADAQLLLLLLSGSLQPLPGTRRICGSTVFHAAFVKYNLWMMLTIGKTILLMTRANRQIHGWDPERKFRKILRSRQFHVDLMYAIFSKMRFQSL